MVSVWERNSLLQADHVVIGAGIVGLCTAYYLKQRFPAQRVLVLERGCIPAGASTRNAGFACMGSASELLDDLQDRSEEDMLALFLFRKQGLERLRQLLGDDQIGYQAKGSYELIMPQDLEVLGELPYLNKVISELIGNEPFSIDNESISRSKFSPTNVLAMIRNHCEAQIDTGMMMRSLKEKVMRSGIEVLGGCIVQSIEEYPHQVEIICRQLGAESLFRFVAADVCVCTNAFTLDLIKGLDIVPGRGQVLLTKPIPNLPFQGIYHFDKGYYYFREYQGAVLFGGGRNKDFETERTSNEGLNPLIQADLIEKLKEIILPGRDFEIDLQWSGIMAFGATKEPIVLAHSSRIFLGVRMGGMGIAIGSEVGFRLASLIP
ncbi:MAG: hypothetical protein RIQ62_1275 [Bacteroidota bacterium]|jgi:glycine/D-amino acid oxidase-like deaminating enzyme